MRIKGTHTYIGADNQQEVQKEDIELDVLGFNNINVTGKNTDEFNVSVYFNNAEDVVSTGDELDNYKFNSATAFYNGYANGPDHIREINIRLEDTDNYYNRNIITTTISTMNGATEEFVNQMWEELNEVVEVETGYDIDTILGTEKEKADQRRAQAEEDELKITGEYPPEVIERAQKIFDTCKLEGADIHIDKDGISVLVRDTVNNIGFWFDIYPSKEGDLEGDWNQYIFNNTITEDLVREALQENGRFFEAVFEVAEDYAMEKDAIKWNDETNKYEFKTESKKAVKKENKKGISKYLKEDFYDGDGDYDEADWEEEAMGEEREPVEEYTILFEDGSEIGEQYHGEFITEDKDEADDLFNELKEEHKLDQVFEYFRKVWEWDRVNEEYYETDVEVYFRAGDEIELYDESKKTESNTEEYWDGTEIARDGFMSLMKFNFGTDSKGNNYIVTVDANDVKRFRADNDKEAVEIYNQFKEEYNNTDHADLTMNIKSIAPREEIKKTEGYSLGDDKESFDVYKHTAEFLNRVGKALEDLGWKFNKEKGKFEKEDITIDMEAIQDNVNDLYIGSNKLKLSKFVDDFSGYEDIGEDTGIIYYVSTKADDYEARQLANKIDRCDIIAESKKVTEAKPEEADKEIWEKVEHIVDAADNELGPDQSAEYDYDEHIKFVIYRDFEYEDIFAVYIYVDGEVQEDLDTGDVHLEDLDATIVDIVKKLQSKEVKTESRYIVYDYADGNTMQDEEEKGLEPSQFTIYDNKADDFYYDELGNNPVFDKEEDAEEYIKKNLTETKYGDSNPDKIVPDAYCDIEKTDSGYYINCGIGTHTNLGSGNFTIYPENYLSNLHKEVKKLAKERGIKRVYDKVKTMIPEYNAMIPEYNANIEDMIKNLTPFAEKSKQGQLTRADLDSIEEITGKITPNRMSTLPEFEWGGKFGRLRSLIGNLKRYETDLSNPLARADTITITESKEVKTEAVRYVIYKNEEPASPYGNPEDGYTQYSDMNEAIADAEEIDADYIEKLIYKNEDEADREELADTVSVVWKNKKKKTEVVDNENKVIVYQIDNVENCDYAFMDYAFAKEKGIDLKDYKKTAEVQVNTDLDGDVNSVLELVFSYGNTNQEYYQENPEARSISVSDILEYNGKKYYVDSFGFEEVVGTQEDNKEKNLTETKYGDSNLDKIVPDAYCEIEKTENGYKLNCGIGDHTNLGSGNFTIYPENYIVDLYEEIKSLAKEKKNKGEIKRVRDNIKDLVPMYNELIPEYNQLIEEMIKDLTPFAEKSKQGQLTRADLDSIEEITGRVSPNRMSTLPEFDWDGKFGKLISFMGNLKKWRNDLADPLSRADVIILTEATLNKFQTLTVDKDGNEMLLKDVSYNNACSWLEKELAKAGSKVVDTEIKGNKTIIKADNKIKFEYDEEKGILKRLEETKSDYIPGEDASNVLELLYGNTVYATCTKQEYADNPDKYKQEVVRSVMKYENTDASEDEILNNIIIRQEDEDLLTEAIDPEQVKEKVEKAKEDIGLKQAEEMVDTENELTDGIKKEIIQYAKQQGLDVEKLQKQGQLNSVAEALDNIIGEMVSKSANEFMDTTGKNIEWDFEVKDNNINVIWNEV